MRATCSPSLASVGGGGEPDLADVVLEVEVGIVDPVRIVEPQRDLLQAPAERREQWQPLHQQEL
jgi:hypothetical protein